MRDENETLVFNDINMTKGSIFKKPGAMGGPIMGKSNLSNFRNLNDGRSVMMRYKHKGLNSLYHIQPKTQNIYILDFKRQSFIKETIASQMLMPSSFTSVQLDSGKIYIVGGLIKDIVMKSTYSLDENLNFSELSNMKTARFSAPVALLNDKYVITAGGQTSVNRNKNTNTAELYEIATNTWTVLDNMLKARSNTSLCAVANKLVFIFHGLPSNTQPSNVNSIEFIDLGSFDAPQVKLAKWESMMVQNNDFITSEPKGSAQISKTEIIIFGGISSDTHSFDYSGVINAPRNGKQPQIARVSKFNDSPLLCDTRFCQECDFTVKTFGNYLYATDGTNENLHVYSIKDKQWNYSRLNELGIE